jgi:hypothetical protein
MSHVYRQPLAFRKLSDELYQPFLREGDLWVLPVLGICFSSDLPHEYLDQHEWHSLVGSISPRDLWLSQKPWYSVTWVRGLPFCFETGWSMAGGFDSIADSGQ